MLVPVPHSLVDDLRDFVRRNVTREGRQEEQGVVEKRKAAREQGLVTAWAPLDAPPPRPHALRHRAGPSDP